MREAITEDKAVEFAEARGWLARKIVYLGRKSSPDRWFFKGGILLIVEFKKVGKPPDPGQAREHKRLRAAGFPVHVVEWLEDFLRLLDQAEARMLLG